MCLILFSWKDHPTYDLVLAANRDEFYERETLVADHWHEHPNVIAGRDQQAGGTWIGINQSTGRIAALTNYRDPKNIKVDAPSRGNLTTNFITGEIGPLEYLKKLRDTAAEYNGFNLLVGNRDSLWYFNNINLNIEQLSPGTYGLSNGLLNDPWPKVQNGKRKLNFLKSNPKISANKQIFPLLADTDLAPDNQLPNTGIPIDLERSLSSMHIDIKGYGTRCSTMILMDSDKTTFVEKTHDIPEHQSPNTQKFTWKH